MSISLTKRHNSQRNFTKHVNHRSDDDRFPLIIFLESEKIHHLLIIIQRKDVEKVVAILTNQVVPHLLLVILVIVKWKSENGRTEVRSKNLRVTRSISHDDYLKSESRKLASGEMKAKLKSISNESILIGTWKWWSARHLKTFLSLSSFAVLLYVFGVSPSSHHHHYNQTKKTCEWSLREEKKILPLEQWWKWWEL